MDRESKAALVMAFLDGCSPADSVRLCRSAGSFVEAAARAEDYFSSGSASQSGKYFQKHHNNRAEREDRAEQVLDWCRHNQVTCLNLLDPDYPPLLLELSVPPPLLFIRGDAQLLSMPQIAIVGSRNASPGGLGNARAFAAALAASGFVITSGLALGIDGAAHDGALQTGKTIAVLGTGLDVIYPRRHDDLYRRIVAQGGAVVSEFLPETPPFAGNFPRRNRIISGLSLGILVVEAALKSGSLITARYGLEQGREVFAIPGSIHSAFSKGTHQLLKQGATLVESAADIAEQLGGLLASMAPDVKTGQQPPTEAGQVLLEAMGFDPVDMDMLVQRTAMSVNTLTQELLLLELEGAIAVGQGIYQRLR